MTFAEGTCLRAGRVMKKPSGRRREPAPLMISGLVAFVPLSGALSAMIDAMGSFVALDDAARAVAALREKLHGEFARHS